MLAIDLSISTCGWDQRDSALQFDSDSQQEINADTISQWEAELLRERLQELLHAAAAATPANDDTETLVRKTYLYYYLTFYLIRLSCFNQELVSMKDLR